MNKNSRDNPAPPEPYPVDPVILSDLPSFRSMGEPIAIPLDALDTTPGPYTMSFGFDPRPMIDSIRTVGLLNPPLIDRGEEGRVRVVAGYRRVAALKALGGGAAQCVDLSGAGLSPREKLLLNLHDNIATRELNGVEKGMALERVLAHFPVQEVIARYMPLLGLPAHGPLLSTYVGIARLEEEGIRAAFAAGRLSVQTAQALGDMGEDSRKMFCEWFENMMFNFNQQSQFIEYITDISHISGRSAAQILSDGELRSILEHPSLNGPQKVKSVLEILRCRRLPTVVRAEESFRKTVRDLRLPQGVRVIHHPYFESPDFRVEISFRDGKTLRQRAAELASVQGLERLGDPWKE